jgi:hypothetical protein
MDQNPKTREGDIPLKKEEKLWDRIRTFLERFREQAISVLTLGKLKLDATNFQRQRGQLFRKLGEEAYKLLKEEKFRKEEVQNLLERIDRINQSILDRMESISIMRANAALKNSKDSGLGNSPLNPASFEDKTEVDQRVHY